MANAQTPIACKSATGGSASNGCQTVYFEADIFSFHRQFKVPFHEDGRLLEKAETCILLWLPSLALIRYSSLFIVRAGRELLIPQLRRLRSSNVTLLEMLHFFILLLSFCLLIKLRK